MTHDFTPMTAKIEGWVRKGYYPGASLRVVQGGRVVYEGHFGCSQAGSVVYLASAGKWLAAAAVAAVVDDGLLSWDDPVAKWLPEFTDLKGRATLRHLLSHTSGFPPYQPAGCPPDDYGTLAESVAHIAPLPAVSEPGVRFDYGGLAMQAAGRMAELATGQDWAALFAERIAAPLRLTGTHFTPVDPGHIPMIGGGARGTLGDYSRFLAMISAEGLFEGRRVVSARTVREMSADQVRGASVPPGQYVEKARGGTHDGVYGLGLWRERLDEQGQAALLSSPGWAGTYPWVDKTRGVCGIFLAHVDEAAAARDGFSAFYASPVLPLLVGQALDGGR